MKTKPLLIEKIPETVKADFKAACAKNRTTMKAEILRHMKDYALNTKIGLRTK